MKVAFMGNPDFAIPSLINILNSEHSLEFVISNPPKPIGRKRVNKYTPVGQYALSKGLRLIEIDVFDDATFSILNNLDVDIFVVVAFKILPKKFINIPKYGSINLHASLLPKYRGAAPIQWVLMNGDTKTGITIFQIKKEVDEGDIINQQSIKIELIDNFKSLSNNLSALGANLLIKSLDDLENNRVNYITQDNSLASKAPKINKKDLKINWTWPAEKINNWIRGLSPSPGMTTKFRDKRIRILKTSLIKPNLFASIALIRSPNKSISIECFLDIVLDTGTNGVWQNNPIFTPGVANLVSLSE